MTAEAMKANFDFDSESHPYIKPAQKIKDESDVKAF